MILESNIKRTSATFLSQLIKKEPKSGVVKGLNKDHSLALVTKKQILKGYLILVRYPNGLSVSEV